MAPLQPATWELANSTAQEERVCLPCWGDAAVPPHPLWIAEGRLGGVKCHPVGNKAKYKTTYDAFWSWIGSWSSFLQMQEGKVEEGGH